LISELCFAVGIHRHTRQRIARRFSGNSQFEICKYDATLRCKKHGSFSGLLRRTVTNHHLGRRSRFKGCQSAPSGPTATLTNAGKKHIENALLVNPNKLHARANIRLARAGQCPRRDCKMRNPFRRRGVSREIARAAASTSVLFPRELVQGYRFTGAIKVVSVAYKTAGAPKNSSALLADSY
jgi:hypothetical protein